MAKSRLGKGLGALFPDLPGEHAAEEEKKVADKEPAAPDIANVSRETLRHQQSGQAAAPVTSVSVKPAETVESSVSKAKSRANGKIKRASIPTLGELTHPSDMFFGPSPAAPVQKPSVSRETSTPFVKEQEVKATVANSSHDESVKNGSAATSASSTDSQNENAKKELKPVAGGYLVELKLTDIGPNEHQPRTIFDEDDLNELAASIKEVGVLQPIVVRKRTHAAPRPESSSSRNSESASRHSELPSSDSELSPRRSKLSPRHSERSEESLSQAQPLSDSSDHSEDSQLPTYELIMGERRWRASQLAGLKTISAIVKTTPDDDMLRDALLENLHRVNLNPLEEAAAYQQMIDEFGLTQAGLSKAVSKSRPQIANMLRLLNLPAAVQKKVAAGVLSAGHARALLSLASEEEMDKLATRIIAEGLSVRSTEEIVAMMNTANETPKKPKPTKTNPWAGSPIQQSLENRFDTKVSIKGSAKHGRIEIVFSSPEDMNRIMNLLVPDSAQPSEDSWV